MQLPEGSPRLLALARHFRQATFELKALPIEPGDVLQLLFASHQQLAIVDLQQRKPILHDAVIVFEFDQPRQPLVRQPAPVKPRRGDRGR